FKMWLDLSSCDFAAFVKENLYFTIVQDARAHWPSPTQLGSVPGPAPGLMGLHDRGHPLVDQVQTKRCTPPGPSLGSRLSLPRAGQAMAEHYVVVNSKLLKIAERNILFQVDYYHILPEFIYPIQEWTNCKNFEKFCFLKSCQKTLIKAESLLHIAFVSDERLGINQDIVLGHSLYYSEDSYIPPSF
ncbi:hypothetical protein MG293_019402, partial [Ovis ammon polii]